MPGHDGIHVREPQALRRKIEGEPFLLASEEDHVVEPASGQKGVATDDGAAGEESKDGRTGQVRFGPERRGLHGGAERVGAFFLPDEDPSGENREPGMRVEDRCGRRQAPGLHHESSSANATYGVVARSTPVLRATAPRFLPSSITSMAGNDARTCAGVPSSDPLSKRMTGQR
ncbi:hypothetical protein BJ988_002740 [Nocardioides panzhihuensis]|uniref:Uncharacterized protein n=1 Tax=Nocardioides panzhihuensis TaxID=860243 RepID=A0A7Z0DMA7_9ACTN|nr:hypothetical protein [Nocardioides panzhihuensis]NYI78092.1 hypothetical protein [Nocardioides panzhihuensis]